MRRAPPPPPPKRRDYKQEEEAFFKAWETRFRAYAKRVSPSNREALGLDLDDVAQDLRWTVMRVVQKYRDVDGRLPDGALITTVIQRRVMALNADARSKYRQLDRAARAARATEDDAPPDVVLDLTTPPPDAHVEDVDRQQALTDITYKLRAGVTPLTFALLQLRYVDGLKPAQIAVHIGQPNGELVTKRLGAARASALTFLRSLGVEALQDVLNPAVQGQEGHHAPSPE